MKKASAIVIYNHLYGENKPFLLQHISLRTINMNRIQLMKYDDVESFDSLYDMVQYVLKLAKLNGYSISLISDDFCSKLWDIDFIEIGEWYSSIYYVREFI